MWWTLSAWLLLCVPGAVLGRRLRLIATDVGLLGLVAEGYLLSFAACLPIVWLGYLLQLPIAALSLFLVALVAGGVGLSLQPLLQRVRDPGVAPRWPWLRGHRGHGLIALACALAIATVVYLSMRAGSATAGDARFHMARVRSLFDEGFNQWDPYVTGHIFTRVYHTNLLHALLASIAQLTGQAPHATWIYSAPFATLAVAAGAFGLVHSACERRGLAWGAAAMASIWAAPIRFSLYPNRLAPALLLALAFGYTCALWQRPARATAIKLSLCAAVVGAVHPLYALFLLVLALPCLGLGAMRLQRANSAARDGRLLVGAALLVLLVAGPSLAISKWHGDHTGPPPPAYPALAGAAPSGPPSGSEPERVPSPLVPALGFRMLPPEVWLDVRSDRLWLLLGACLGLWSQRRAAYLGLLALGLCLSAIGYVPPLCAAFAAATGFDWTLDRLAGLYPLLWLPAISGAFLFVDERLRARLGRVPSAALEGLFVAGLLLDAGLRGGGHGHYDREHLLSRAKSTAAARDVAGLDRRKRLLAGLLRPGDTVLAGLDMPGNVTPLLRVRFVGVARSGAPLPDWRRRMRDSWSMLNDRHMDQRVRRQLYDYYGVDRVLLRAHGKTFAPRSAARFYKRLRDVVVRSHQAGPWLVFDTERAHE